MLPFHGIGNCPTPGGILREYSIIGVKSVTVDALERNASDKNVVYGQRRRQGSFGTLGIGISLLLMVSTKPDYGRQKTQVTHVSFAPR
jgi:hypothetical protein